MKTIAAGVLEVGYLDDGAPGGWPVVLSHGFPYDVHAYDDVVPLLTGQGHRVAEAGHNLPQEAPVAFADAVLTVHGWRACSLASQAAVTRDSRPAQRGHRAQLPGLCRRSRVGGVDVD